MMSHELPGIIAESSDIFKSIFNMSNNIGLKIVHFNSQSMNPRNSKFVEIYNLLYNSKVDIICVSETWWDSYITDSGVELP